MSESFLLGAQTLVSWFLRCLHVLLGPDTMPSLEESLVALVAELCSKPHGTGAKWGSWLWIPSLDQGHQTPLLRLFPPCAVFPADVTKYQELGGLKQPKYIVSLF